MAEEKKEKKEENIQEQTSLPEKSDSKGSKRVPQEIDEGRVREAIELIRSGKTIEDAALEVGYSPQGLRHAVRRLGLKDEWDAAKKEAAARRIKEITERRRQGREVRKASGGTVRTDELRETDREVVIREIAERTPPKPERKDEGESKKKDVQKGGSKEQQKKTWLWFGIGAVAAIVLYVGWIWWERKRKMAAQKTPSNEDYRQRRLQELIEQYRYRRSG